MFDEAKMTNRRTLTNANPETCSITDVRSGVCCAGVCALGLGHASGVQVTLGPVDARRELRSNGVNRKGWDAVIGSRTVSVVFPTTCEGVADVKATATPTTE